MFRRRARLDRAKISTTKKWRNFQQLKAHARYLTAQAVKEGTLVPLPCAGGCDIPLHKVQIHHEDYTRPLEVNWLCRLCHRDRHKEIGALNKPNSPGKSRIYMSHNTFVLDDRRQLSTG